MILAGSHYFPSAKSLVTTFEQSKIIAGSVKQIPQIGQQFQDHKHAIPYSGWYEAPVPMLLIHAHMPAKYALKSVSTQSSPR